MSLSSAVQFYNRKIRSLSTYFFEAIVNIHDQVSVTITTSRCLFDLQQQPPLLLLLLIMTRNAIILAETYLRHLDAMTS